MALNANYILAGQQVDPVGAIGRGAQVGQQVNEFQNTNALRQMYRERGADILRGDENALAALAQFSPQEALGVQTARLGQDSTRLNMQATQQRMAMLSREEQRQVEAAAAQMTAQERAAEAARIEQGVASALQAQTPEQWDAIVGQYDPSLVGQFENRNVIAGRYMSVAESIKRMDEMNAAPDAPTPQSQIAKLQADLNNNLITKDQYELEVQRLAPSGMSLSVGADGEISFAQGAGVGGGATFTEGQGKDNVFATRARGALDVLEPVADALANRVERGLEYVPFGIGREFQSPEFQVGTQAADEFLQAILRKDTGAAITEPEQMLYGRTYIPQPGDGPDVLAAKADARRRALAALESGMNAEQMVARDQALIRAAQGGSSQQSGSEPDAPPALGDVMDGFRFRGGDPARQENWEPI